MCVTIRVMVEKCFTYTFHYSRVKGGKGFANGFAENVQHFACIGLGQAGFGRNDGNQFGFVHDFGPLHS